MREWLRRLGGALRSWWRRHRPINPWQPGHSKIERLKALNDEMRWVEDRSDAELIVRLRVEG